MKLCVSLFEDMGCTLIDISFISVHDTQKTSVINSLYPDSRQNPINQSITSMEQRRGRGEILSVNCALKSMQIQCGFGTCFDFIPVNLCSKFCLRLETIRGRRIATNDHFPIAIGKFIIIFFLSVYLKFVWKVLKTIWKWEKNRHKSQTKRKLRHRNNVSFSKYMYNSNKNQL